MPNAKGQFVKGEHWRKPQPFREKGWLLAHYRDKGMSAGEIAAMFGVTDSAIHFWLHRHKIPLRSVSAARALKHWGASGPDNPMWNKRGELNPSWRGGITTERQAFYAGRPWKLACSAVWKRDHATCRRCSVTAAEAVVPMHVHHIVSFADKSLRADAANLVLLCEVCHHFVHSKKNTAREFLPRKRHPG